MSIDLSRIDDKDLCRMVADPPQDNPLYSPGDCWSESYLQQRSLPRLAAKLVDPNWLPNTIEATPVLVSIPTRMPAAHEVAALWAYRQTLRARMHREIVEQNMEATASVPRALRELLGPAEVPVMNCLQEQFDALNKAAIAVTIQQKLLFNRARPWQTIPGLGEAILRPRHASYPSGHATEAFACALMWCEVLSRVDGGGGRLSRVMTDLLHQANRVAVNREIGGVHYPSDTAAGVELAQRIVAYAAPKLIGDDPSSYKPEFMAFKKAIEAVLKAP